jgi:hypothetical protein
MRFGEGLNLSSARVIVAQPAADEHESANAPEGIAPTQLLRFRR